MMKVIGSTDVMTMHSELVQPGDVLVEGIVLATETTATDEVVLRTVTGSHVFGRQDLVHVFARLDDLARQIVIADHMR